ncbi:manganese-dependent inorganic pyrophosphatase [Thermodesulfitimonas autotrophica]|jgi:manganese-dependent inorganic pyrophosphatase|uniref:inorganic diphosphatase n=1 Tax=Thermodesulfitimonas autotrophica TaxID=1894989 RepID=A0A3N5AWL5_9THEO|nr:manganese-dependent inorganic pyrophosphatase [Thermodesulfitimonas autotrophica]RPF49364.1 manganese-dependent inorganic pyrophosphatase [Thermodesulfitimonas autotrophica]
MSEVYVIGHKSPDTDTVCSAIVYAALKGYTPARPGELNEETAYVLDYFKVPAPVLLENAAGKKLVLVDHNEPAQVVNGGDQAEIIEVIDHHKMNFVCNKPIYVHVEPVGSTATVIAKQYMDKIKTNPTWAGLLLAAILSDTVIFKSPTTTDEDKAIAAELAKVAGIADVQAFGIDIKKAKASIKGKPIADVIHVDFKDFDFGGKKVGIGQTELVDINEAYDRKDEIVNYLNELKANKGYAMVVFIATDIIKEGSELYFAGDPAMMEKAFGVKPEGPSFWLQGCMSRKKQVAPPLEKAFTS